MRSSLLLAGTCIAGVLAYAGYLDSQDARRRAQKLARRRLEYRRRLAINTRKRRAKSRLDHASAILRRLEGLHAGFTAQTSWPKLLELGDFYRKGAYPWFRPNRLMASKIYHVACASPDPDISGAAQLRYIECRVDDISKEDVHGAKIPTMYGLGCIARATDAIRDSKGERFGTPYRFFPENVSVDPEPEPEPEPPRIVVSDGQNVHDHAMTAALRRSLRSSDTSRDAYDRVMECVLDSADGSTKEDAFRVLESLDTATHTGLYASEREALNGMWARIDSLPDETDRQNARAMLVSQLASGVENGAIVCSTGKIARIMGTLDGMSDAPEAPEALKPTWVVRDEIGTLAAKVRNDGGDAHEFRRRAVQTYVDELGMHSKIVGTLVDEFAVGF